MVIDERVKQTLNKYASEYYKADKKDDKNRIDEVCRKIGIDTLGGDIIGSGKGRNTFDMDILRHPNYVLKLATFDSKYDGVEQNKYEAKTWESATEKQKQFLVPVITHGKDYYWLIMEKGNTNTKGTYEWRRKAKTHLEGIVWKEDIREENIVKLNGELKLCDYGTAVE